MALDGYHEHDFTDYFQLLKVDGRWWIVSKRFHADPPKQVRLTRTTGKYAIEELTLGGRLSPIALVADDEETRHQSKGKG